MTLNQTSIFGPGDSGGSGGGSGDVNGPASSTNNAVAIFSGTDGKLLKNSTLTNPSAGVLNIPSGGDLTFNSVASSGTGAFTRVTTPTFVTPVLGAATATSINFGDTTFSRYVKGTYTPVMTLVGGAGDITPVYTTNTAQYIAVGDLIYVTIQFSGDGGAEGAGTGVINISLPNIARTGTAGLTILPAGRMRNGATTQSIVGVVAGTATTVYLNTLAGVDLTGADQNNTTRNIYLSFAYIL